MMKEREEWVEIDVGTDFEEEVKRNLESIKMIDSNFNGLTLQDIEGFHINHLRIPRCDDIDRMVTRMVLQDVYRSRKRAVEAYAKIEGITMAQARKMIQPRKIEK